MSSFHRDSAGRACLSGLPLEEALKQAGVSTPAYVYDLDAIEAEARELVTALGEEHVVAYAIKANSAASVVKRIAAAGAGADLVSGGELRAQLCDRPPRVADQ